jgi:hypothetical protein
MPDDDRILREKARDAIQSGRLPATIPTRTYGGFSTGTTCAVCGDTVPTGEVEYELEFPVAPPPDDRSLGEMLERLHAQERVRHYHVHVRCFAAWQIECVRMGAPDRRPST